MDTGRRGFLRGRSSRPARLRPPWARPDDEDFRSACSRCGDCVRSCPVQVLHAGDGGYPEIDFARTGCTLCGECVRVCTPGALRRVDAARPWTLTAVFGQACLAARRVECRVCGEVCDEGAIRFCPVLGGVAQPSLDADRCTGCGQCVAPCPAGAICMERAEP